MSQVQYSDDLPVAAPRSRRWLPALERELRLRIGWVDEVISPFKRARMAARRKFRGRRPKQ